MRSLLVILALASGCIIEHDSGSGGPDPGPACSTAPTYSIDTGATLSYVVGVDAGYYASYAAGGAWHFEWTCDTNLSAVGCNFTGTITAPTPAGGANPTCFRCEADDILNASESGGNTSMQFDTLTSTGIDGIDFTSVAGSPIAIDLQINGLYQDNLVFIPSGGAALTPACVPANVAPSSP